MNWLTNEMSNTLIAGALGIFGVIIGGAFGFWAAHRLQSQVAEAERNRISYAIFAGLLSVQCFLDGLLNEDNESHEQKVQRLSETDFYCRVFEENLGNLGTLGPGEAILLYEVYKDLKIISGKCSSVMERVEARDSRPSLYPGSYGVDDEFASTVLQEVKAVLKQTVSLVSMMAEQHGFESYTLKDLADMGVEVPSDLVAKDADR